MLFRMGERMRTRAVLAFSVVCCYTNVQITVTAGHNTEGFEAEIECPEPIKSTECHPTKDQCAGDSECAEHYKCCFNGCFRGCLRQDPPSVIDWDSDPFLRVHSGVAPGIWKKEVDGDEVFLNPVHSCSTSMLSPPSAPSSCAVGFVCRIQDHGDPLLGVPNSGICVPHHYHRQYVKSQDDKEPTLREKSGSETVYLPGGCSLTKEQFEHVQDFQDLPYVINCSCIQGSVDCILEKDKDAKKRSTVIK